jgi:hypothetical protein
VNEFGSTSSVADWVELEALGAQSVNALMDNLEVPTTFNENGYYVTNNGAKVYSGSRVYFFERHDGNPPGNWAVHSVIGDITLGSWYDMNQPVLCVTSPGESGGLNTVLIAVIAAVVGTTCCVCLCCCAGLGRNYYMHERADAKDARPQPEASSSGKPGEDQVDFDNNEQHCTSATVSV